MQDAEEQRLRQWSVDTNVLWSMCNNHWTKNHCIILSLTGVYSTGRRMSHMQKYLTAECKASYHKWELEFSELISWGYSLSYDTQ